VFDERRGEVEIVAITDGLIPWPIGKRYGRWATILFDVLVGAARTESNQAVAHWWSVRPNADKVAEEALCSMMMKPPCSPGATTEQCTIGP